MDLKSFAILELLLMHQKWQHNKKLIWEYKIIFGLSGTLKIITKHEKFLLINLFFCYHDSRNFWTLIKPSHKELEKYNKRLFRAKPKCRFVIVSLKASASSTIKVIICTIIVMLWSQQSLLLGNEQTSGCFSLIIHRLS